jgi:hypothetical protein
MIVADCRSSVPIPIPVTQGRQTGSAVPERPLAYNLTGGIEKADLVPL